MYQVNTLYTWNWHNAIRQLCFSEAGEKRQHKRVLGREISWCRSELVREELASLTFSNRISGLFLLPSPSDPKSSSSPFPKHLALSSWGSQFKDRSVPGSWILAEAFWRLKRHEASRVASFWCLLFLGDCFPAWKTVKHFHRYFVTSPYLTEPMQNDCWCVWSARGPSVWGREGEEGCCEWIPSFTESSERQRSLGTEHGAVSPSICF